MPVNAPRKSRSDNNNLQPSFDSVINNSSYRKPTFSYIPIHKRQCSGGSSSIFLRSLSLNSLSMPASQSFKDSKEFLTPNSLYTPEIPSTPNSVYSMPDTTEYTSFPNLDHFADECWTEVHAEKRNSISELEMESYDEMLVGNVRFQYS
ncbi:10235_t:CDS:2 [Racocetra persica]|uniref:10235_t:CDS:1 n=1 Tax=Racocetra persica TaxID=160502 RepID=A0ACA9LL00_9GLOM|nr:10235_t:CDS:2 [Racocetra persica]